MMHYLAPALPLLLAGALLASGNVTPGMNRFAAAAYRQLASGDENLILSPFSISTALSMLLDGARGQTAAGMAATLEQLHTGPDYHAAVAALAAELAKAGNQGSNQLSIANAVWVQHGYPLESAFEQTMRNQYQAPLTPLNFANPVDAAGRINSWTAEETKGRIERLISPGSLDRSTRLVLTSAIYFLGKWRFPFDPHNTREDQFYPAGGGAAETEFMHRKADFRYAETPSVQILEMPYDGTPLAFDILLPKEKNGLAQLEAAMNPKALSAWFGSLQEHSVQAAIPKFRAESTFSLKAMLSRMGMAEAFGQSADFSGIDGRRDLYVSDVVHKAFVDVSEEGTEAAAATGAIVTFMAMHPHPQPIIFRADHPFAFFIRDTASGVILFEGRLLRPAP